MKKYDYFDRTVRVMNIEDRLKFYLLIWRKGGFKNTILEELHIEDSRELEMVVNEFNKKGFLEILEHKDNTAIPKYDAFYFVSDDNLKSILKHICEFSSLAYSDMVYELIQEDRINYDPLIIEEFTQKMQQKELKDRVLLLLLEKSVSFFFIYIMEFGKLFKEKEELRFYFNDFMIESLVVSLIRSIKLNLLEKEYSEKDARRNDTGFYEVNPWGKNII